MCHHGTKHPGISKNILFIAKDTIPKFEGLGPFRKIEVFALIILDVQIFKLHSMVVTLRWALNSFSLKFLLFRSVLQFCGVDLQMVYKFCMDCKGEIARIARRKKQVFCAYQTFC